MGIVREAEVSCVRDWARLLSRPVDLVEQTRWGGFMAAVAGLLIVLPWPFTSQSPSSIPVALPAAALLIGAWTFRYLTHRAPTSLDVVEVLALGAMAVASPAPSMLIGCILLTLWLRALYGSSWQLGLYTLLLIAVLLVALPLWEALPGRDRNAAPIAIMASMPMLLLGAAVARHLALGLFTRGQSRLRDAALVRLGNELIGVTDKDTIHRRAGDCARTICAVTPGMRAMFVLGDERSLRVVDYTGKFRTPPETLSPGIPTDLAGAHVWPLLDNQLLDDAAGERCAWMALPLPEEPEGWIVLGAPRRVPQEAVAAMQSMINQAALALRTSAAHQDLAAQAHLDGLTGLANRAALITALGYAITDPDRDLALLFLDLDDFKVINDRFGHAAADELLRVVAGRLHAAVRPDDLCARLGGDEFAVLLQGAADAAEAVAQRLVRQVGAPISLSQQLVHVGVSVGLACATPGTSAERLVQQADIAMYAAKAKGKNRVQVFDRSLLLDAGQAAFEADLHAAADAGQLVVHYQPIVAVPDGACVAVEALVRWRHPTRGLLGPAEFIPTAERTGAIVDIGAFVLRRACADSAEWRRLGGQLAVHVNVSAAQLTAAGFADEVRRCMTEYHMAPQQLVLEITESMVLDSPAIRWALDRLVELGAAIAIDDFGTGYSALSTLRALPLDIVKLDKSFITGGHSDTTDEAVVGAIVQMAGRLGLQIVAEGVERLDQQRFLEEVGADAVQGYLHLRPTPATEFAAWLRQRGVAAGRGSTVTPIAPRRSG